MNENRCLKTVRRVTVEMTDNECCANNADDKNQTRCFSQKHRDTAMGNPKPKPQTPEPKALKPKPETLGPEP